MSFFEEERLRLRMMDELRGALRPLEQLQAAADALAEALVARDMQAVDALLADESAMMLCKRMLRGKSEILETLRIYLAEPRPPIRYDCLQIEVKANGLIAFSSGSLFEGAERAAIGSFESIWRSDDDRGWRLIFVQASSAGAVIDDFAT